MLGPDQGDKPGQGRHLPVIEPRRWLVEEEARLGRQGPGQLDPLQRAEGQARRGVARDGLEPEELDEFLRPRLHPGLLGPEPRQSQGARHEVPARASVRTHHDICRTVRLGKRATFWNVRLVRIRVDPAGGLEAWVIGKDDPLGPGRPVLVHHFAWRRPP